MKYIKLYEQIFKSRNFIPPVNENRINLEEVFPFNVTKKKWEPEKFEKFKGIIEYLRNCNLSIKENMYIVRGFSFLFDRVSMYLNYHTKKSDHSKMYAFISFSPDVLYTLIKKIKSKFPNHNFYDLGSGVGITCLVADNLGCKISRGFEINETWVEKAHELGFEKYVLQKDITKLNNSDFSGPKIIYYYSPFRDRKLMVDFENKVVKDYLNVGDILIRVSVFGVNDFDENNPNMEKMFFFNKKISDMQDWELYIKVN